MVKVFCDHCGKEIVNIKEIYEIDERDFPDIAYSEGRQFFDKKLCEVCYHRRLQWHLDVDEAFFHMVKEE